MQDGNSDNEDILDDNRDNDSGDNDNEIQGIADSEVRVIFSTILVLRTYILDNIQTRIKIALLTLCRHCIKVLFGK